MYNAIIAAETWRLFGILGVWQLAAIALLIVLVIFWINYRKRQM